MTADWPDVNCATARMTGLMVACHCGAVSNPRCGHTAPVARPRSAASLFPVPVLGQLHVWCMKSNALVAHKVCTAAEAALRS